MEGFLSPQRLPRAAEGGHGQAQDLKSVGDFKGPSASTLLYLTESSDPPSLRFIYLLGSVGKFNPRPLLFTC